MDTFRALGCSVKSTHQVADGFPDTVVGFMNMNFLVEIKDGSLPPSKRKLTPDEKKFHDEWRGSKDIVETTEDCIQLVAKWRRMAQAVQRQYE